MYTINFQTMKSMKYLLTIILPTVESIDKSKNQSNDTVNDTVCIYYIETLPICL